MTDRVYAALAKAAEDEQEILNRELSHRLKNSLAMVQAMAGQTLRNAVDKEVLSDFLRRLSGLATAHDVLLHRNWEAAKMGTVVQSTIGSFSHVDRFRIEGPLIDLSPRSALALSMALHELATNAVKYGALSVESGSVSIDWTIESTFNGNDDLVVTWTESGDPPVLPPTRKGFGSRLIGLGLTGTGGVDLRYEQSGLITTLRSTLKQLQGV